MALKGSRSSFTLATGIALCLINFPLIDQVDAVSAAAAYGAVSEPELASPPLSQAFEPLCEPARIYRKGGMAQARTFLAAATLNVFDTPLRYRTPVGPAMEFRINYSQIEALPMWEADRKSISNLGPGWSLNWIAFLSVDSAKNVIVRVPGGGAETYNYLGNTTEPYGHGLVSHAGLKVAGDNVYERLLPDGSMEVYDLKHPDGRLIMTRIVDRHGNSVKVNYDDHFRIASVVDAIGQKTIVTHASDTASDAGFFKIAKITDPFGRSCKFGYDGQMHNLLTSTDTIGLVSRFNYDSQTHTINSMTTPYGTTSFHSYVPNGAPQGSRGLKTTYANGSTSVVENWSGAIRQSYSWSREAMKLYPTDPEKRLHMHCTTIQWLPDTSGRQIAVKSFEKPPLENRIKYVYEGETEKGFTGTSNLPIRVIRTVPAANESGTTFDALQARSYEYNPFGHVTREVDPVGRVFTYKYAENGIDLLEIKQCRGKNNELLYKWEYDTRHLPVLFTDGSGQHWKAEHNSFGQPTITVDPLSNAWSRTYDSHGYLLSIAGPKPATKSLVAYSYDRCGRTRTITNADGYTVSFDYDDADRPTRAGYPDGTSERLLYDRLDAVCFTGRMGDTTKRTYNSMEQVASQTDPLGRELKLTWCHCCNALESFTDAGGHTTTFERDLEGRMVRKIFPDKTSVHFTYEQGTSRLHSRTDALNQTTTFAYAVDDTIARVSHANARIPTSTFKAVYDQDYPRLISVENGCGKIQLDYYPRISDSSASATTGAGKLRAVSNSAIARSTLAYRYDEVGRLINRSIDGEQNSETLKYDPLGFVTSDTNALGEFKYNYAYTPNQDQKSIWMLSSVDYPNGQSTDLKYFDNADDHRIREIVNKLPSSSALSRFEYKHNAKGDVVQWRQGFDGNAFMDYNFVYDAAGQLKEAQLTGKDRTLPFAPEFHYNFDAASNRTLAKNGSESSKASYNELNQLCTVSSQHGKRQLQYDANGNLIDDGINKYEWNAENRLVKIIYPGDNNYSALAYDALQRLASLTEVHNGNEKEKKQFVWSSTQMCEERNTSGSVTRQFFPKGERIGGANYYYTSDHLGSVREMTDKKGNVCARYHYDPFGVVAKSKGELSARFQYAKYYFHERSGLCFALYRAYSPQLGRWISRDLVGEEGGINLYAYVDNRAVNFRDLSGLAYITWNTVHPQLVFSDGSNVGFGNGGIARNVDVSGYWPGPAPTQYDDTLMKNAVEQIISEGGWDPAYVAPNDPLALILSPLTTIKDTVIGHGDPNAYHATGNNCEDFMNTVLDRYNMLFDLQSTQKKKCPP